MKYKYFSAKEILGFTIIISLLALTAFLISYSVWTVGLALIILALGFAYAIGANMRD